MRIVVLEDDKDYREVLTQILEDAGHEVFGAETGFDIVDELVHGSPDLILLDLVLPTLSGDSVIDLFKKKDVIREVPVIILSSKDEEEIKAAADKISAAGWLRKPVDKDELLEAVEKYTK